MDQFKQNLDKQVELLRRDGYLDAAKLLEGLYQMCTATLRRVEIYKALAEHYRSQLPLDPEEYADEQDL